MVQPSREGRAALQQAALVETARTHQGIAMSARSIDCAWSPTALLSCHGHATSLLGHCGYASRRIRSAHLIGTPQFPTGDIHASSAVRRRHQRSGVSAGQSVSRNNPMHGVQAHRVEGAGRAEGAPGTPEATCPSGALLHRTSRNQDAKPGRVGAFRGSRPARSFPGARRLASHRQGWTPYSGPPLSQASS